MRTRARVWVMFRGPAFTTPFVRVDRRLNQLTRPTTINKDAAPLFSHPPHQQSPFVMSGHPAVPVGGAPAVDAGSTVPSSVKSPATC